MSRDTREDPPLGQSSSAVKLHVALKVEGVADGGVGGEKSLRRACTLEPDPTSFSASDWLMRILRPIVRAASGDMSIA